MTLAAPPPPPAVVLAAQLPADAAAYVVYAPLLYHAGLSNVLKKASAQGVPVTLVTTRNGLLQGNALLLSVAVQVNTSTYNSTFTGDARGSVQVLSKGQWQVYSLDGATLTKAEPSRMNDFNRWLGTMLKTSAPLDPGGIMRLWLWENRKISSF